MKRILLVLMLELCVCSIAPAVDLSEIRSKADAGDVAAMMKLASAFESGNGVLKDPYQAFDWYMKAAHAGNAEAQNTVGVYLRTGDGGRKDPVEAVRWYRESAKQGNSNAMYNLATAFYNGDGVQISDREALAWFIVAKEFGNKQADDAVQRSLAEVKPVTATSGTALACQMLMSGTQVPLNGKAAIPWLQKLMDSNHPMASVMLAQIYLDGNGVPKNPDLAMQYCGEGANAKLPQAMRCIGHMYHKGIGKPLDLKEAVKWYTKAAKCGDPVSMFVLSDMYGSGEGVKEDRIQQIALLMQSARFVPQAQQKLTELQSQMSEKDLKRAQSKMFAADRGCSYDASMQ